MRTAAVIVVAFVLQEIALPALEGASFASGITAAAQSVGPTLFAVNAGISGGAVGFVSTGTLRGAIVGSGQALALEAEFEGLQMTVTAISRVAMVKAKRVVQLVTMPLLCAGCDTMHAPI